ncbi:MAG: hypothetical protein L6R28_13775 [Planctomycetes bacterium]|nr:hypothetical protein [Planctomycetota bacterium]
MLKKLKIPEFTERLYGFTIPEGGKLFACDHDEAFEISLSDPPTVKVLDESPYEFIDSFENALGVPEGVPIHVLGDKRIVYSFDGRDDFVEVTVTHGANSEKLSFRTFSGDWFVGTLSKCGKYLLLAEPYLIECYEFA